MERNERLFSAVEKESTVDVRILLEQGADPLAFVSSGMNSVGLAASIGNVNLLSRLLEAVNPPGIEELSTEWMEFEETMPEGMGDLEWDEEIDSEKGFSPDKEWLDLYSYYARTWENIGQVLDTAKDLKDVHCLDRQQHAPLHYASKFGHLQCVRLLVGDFKCPVDIHTYSGQTALHLACEYQHPKIVKYLLQNGAMVNGKTFKVEDTALLKAAKNGNNAIIQILLDHGASINTCNAYDVSPLIGATFFGHCETVKLLIARGANVNLKDRDGLTPLVIAVHNEAEETVRHLLDNGARIILSHNLVHTAINLDNDEILRLLIKAGESVVRGKDSYGLTPIDKIIQRGNVEMLRFCYEFFSFAECPTFDSSRELIMALHCDDVRKFRQMLRFFLSLGRNVDENDSFLMGIKLRKFDHVKLLLRENATVNTDYNEEVVEMLQRDTDENRDMLRYLIAAGFRIHKVTTLRTRFATSSAIQSGVDQCLHAAYTNALSLQSLARIEIRRTLKEGKHVSEFHSLSGCSPKQTPFERALWHCGLPPRLIRFTYEYSDLEEDTNEAMTCSS